MKVSIKQEIDELKYSNLLLDNFNTMIYQSFKYLIFLKELTKSELYFITIENVNELLAVMPFLSKSTKHGKVINSLPFYGSNGSVVSKNDNSDYKKLILNSYKSYISSDKSIIGSTIINTPFELHAELYNDILMPNYIDERIGQLTPLNGSNEDVFNSFHFKTRNSIRKGEKSNLSITFDDGLDYLDFLYQTHKENISSIGGLYKKEMVFELIKSNFEYGKDFKIFVAKQNNIPVCALLNFYFNRTVEYYTPVIVKEYRDLQPLSAVIWFAMKDAIRNNYKWWNWGGTWFTQKGVYDFKKRWGTQEFNYKYFINSHKDNFAGLSKENILNDFEYFYTIPFNILN